MYSLYINRQGLQVIHGLRTNDKYEYTSKTMKRTNRKITLNADNLLPYQKQIVFQNSPEKTRNGQKIFFPKFWLSPCGMPHVRATIIKSQIVTSLHGQSTMSSCHCSLTNEFTLWDLKKWSLVEPVASPHGNRQNVGKTSETFVRFVVFSGCFEIQGYINNNI